MIVITLENTNARNVYPDIEFLSYLHTVKSHVCSNRDCKSNAHIQKAMSPCDNKCDYINEGSGSKNNINNCLKNYEFKPRKNKQKEEAFKELQLEYITFNTGISLHCS